MRNLECRNTRREIDESELHQALSDTPAMHLQQCSGCRAFREERARLRDLVGSLDPVCAPADFDFRLRARLAAQTQSIARPGLFQRFGMSLPATVAAAVAVLLLGTIVWVNQRHRTQAPFVAQKNEQSNQTGSSTSSRTDEPATPNTANTPANETVAVNTQPQIRKPFRSSSRPASVRSAELDEKPAPSIKIDDGVSLPVKPVVVSMEDDRGATRTISLPPVSFGSQRLVDNRPVSQPGNRVW
jgi:hypothetical protein